MLPTGEQLSTSSTLNNLSNREDGIRGAGFLALLLLYTEDGEEYRAHHGLCAAVLIALFHSGVPFLLSIAAAPGAACCWMNKPCCLGKGAVL